MRKVYVLMEGTHYYIGCERFTDFHIHSCYLDEEKAAEVQKALPNSYVEWSELIDGKGKSDA